MNVPVATVSFIDKSRSTGPVAEESFSGVSQALLSIADMDRILLASPFSLSQKRVDSMSLSDKQYFIKTAVDEGTASTIDLLPPVITDTVAPTNEVHPYGTVWHDSVGVATYQTPGDGTWTQVV